MGGSSSKKHSSRHSYSYETPSYSYPSTPHRPSYGSNYTDPDIMSRLHSKYSRIADDFASLDQVTAALAQAGLESSNLIVGIDFTKSNEWTEVDVTNRDKASVIGKRSRKDLAFVITYKAISIIGRTLSAFDEDNLIPCYGFGDASTHDQEVFSFFPEERPCNGFEEALLQYREIIPHLKLAGPTSFAPIIETAVGIVEKSGGQYHVLLIIADGQVTRSVDTDPQHLSPQEQNTINAIVGASEYPLSIVLVGVGDGPWDMMRQFDDNIPARAFDNFQFVNFTEIMSRNIPPFKKEAEFALAALMEIPSQYKATLDLHLLGHRRGTLARVPLPPPVQCYSPPNYGPTYSQSSSLNQSGSYSASSPTAPEISRWNNQMCALCLWNAKDLAFGCGHQTCYDCGQDLKYCPICRSHIATKIRLY